MSDEAAPISKPPAAEGVRIDEHIGAKVRSQRRALDMTQDELARRIGVTAQQIHKYESGVNRISASKLFEIATAMARPVAAFFAGLPEPAVEDEQTARLLADKDVLELAQRFDAIEEGALRRTVLRMVRAAADDTAIDAD